MPTATITFGTFASDSTGAAGVAWTNAANAASQNTTYATSSLNDGEVTQRLKATAPASGATAIDDAATISAIRVFVRAKSAGGGDNNIYEAYVVKGGTTQTGGTNHAASPTALTTSDATYQFGSADTFGVAFTGADVKAAGFGCSIRVGDTSGEEAAVTVSVDYIYAEVDYTNPPAGGPLIDRTRNRLLMSPRRVP